jgi:hypothetical protein
MDAEQLKVCMPADPKKYLDFSYDTLYWEKKYILAHYRVCKSEAIQRSIDVAGKFMVLSELLQTAFNNLPGGGDTTLILQYIYNALTKDQMLYNFKQGWKVVDFRFAFHEALRADADPNQNQIYDLPNDGRKKKTRNGIL